MPEISKKLRRNCATHKVPSIRGGFVQRIMLPQSWDTLANLTGQYIPSCLNIVMDRPNSWIRYQIIRLLRPRTAEVGTRAASGPWAIGLPLRVEAIGQGVHLPQDAPARDAFHGVTGPFEDHRQRIVGNPGGRHAPRSAERDYPHLTARRLRRRSGRPVRRRTAQGNRPPPTAPTQFR